MEFDELLRSALGWRDLDEFIQKLVSRLSKEFDTVIVNGEILYSTRIRFSNYRHDLTKHMVEDSIDVMVKKGKSYTTVSLDSVSTLDLDSVVEFIHKSFRLIDRQEEYIPPEAGFETYDIIPGVYNDSVFEQDFLYRLLEAILSTDAGGVERLSGIISAEAGRRLMASSYGASGEYKYSRFNIRVRGFKDSELTATSSILSTSVDEEDAESMVREVSSRLEGADKPVLPERRKTRVVFTPDAFSNLLSYLSSMLSAYNYYTGISVFSGQLGEDIGARALVYDDPRMENSPASITFDEEGVPTRKTVYIEGGVLRDLAFNNTLARRMGRESNGHAGLIIPHMHHVVYRCDDVAKDEEELLKTVGEGIYITNLWYTRYSNVREGSLSTMQRDVGFLIEGGELTKPVIGARLSLNIKDLVVRPILSTEPIKWSLPWDVDTPSLTGYVALEDVVVTTGF